MGKQKVNKPAKLTLLEVMRKTKVLSISVKQAGLPF
jgi:hypothetical protein